MMGETGNHPKNSRSYTYDEINCRFESCKGRTLGEIDSTGVFSGKSGNKGVAGAVVEQSILGYPPDSRQAPDIEIDGTPYEVKTTGLVLGGKSQREDGWGLTREDLKHLEAKEPMSITAVSVDEIWREEFSNSAFWHKLEHMLIAYYLYNGGSSSKVDSVLDYAAFPFIDYEMHRWDDDDRAVLASDWKIVHDFVARVHEEGLNPDEEYPKISHELNRRLMYTDTSPKWPNRPRWRLKRSTVTAMVQEHFSDELEHLPVQLRSYSDIERVCQDITADYRDASIAELARELGYEGRTDGKSVAEGLVVRMFGGRAKKLSKIDAFAKAGICCKTVRFSNGQVNLAEDVKLSRIDFDELLDFSVPWEESNALETFSGRFLCAVFAEARVDAPLSENVFSGFKWIEFDDEVIDEARAVWTEMRRLVKTKELRDVPVVKRDGTPRINKTGLPSTAPNWPKARDARVVFVRGDSRNSSMKPLVVNKIRMYNQYFWIKKRWMAKRLQKVPFI